MTTITSAFVLDGLERDAAWRLYREAFAPLQVLAANRHMMTIDEFDVVCADRRVVKYIARDDTTREVVGVGTLINDLAAWPLLSPQYFAAHWPRQYEARLIWYVGFMAVDTPRAAASTFADLLTVMSIPVRACGGMAFMDFCDYNVERRLPGTAQRILGAIDSRLHTQEVDAQRFWMFSFDAYPEAGDQ